MLYATLADERMGGIAAENHLAQVQASPVSYRVQGAYRRGGFMYGPGEQHIGGRASSEKASCQQRGFVSSGKAGPVLFLPVTGCSLTGFS